jgi:hypothetical protein
VRASKGVSLIYARNNGEKSFDMKADKKRKLFFIIVSGAK